MKTYKIRPVAWEKATVRRWDVYCSEKRIGAILEAAHRNKPSGFVPVSFRVSRTFEFSSFLAAARFVRRSAAL